MTIATRYSRAELTLSRTQAREVETVRRPGLAADIQPAGTTDLFTITGAPVLIYRLVGVVTTVIGAGAATLRFAFLPTGGGAQTNMSAISAAINADAVNGTYTWSGALLGLITPGVGIGHLDLTGAEAGFASPITCTPGTIRLVVAVGATTGVIDWYLDYLGLTAGALVVAA